MNDPKVQAQRDRLRGHEGVIMFNGHTHRLWVPADDLEAAQRESTLRGERLDSHAREIQCLRQAKLADAAERAQERARLSSIALDAQLRLRECQAMLEETIERAATAEQSEIAAHKRTAQALAERDEARDLACVLAAAVIGVPIVDGSIEISATLQTPLRYVSISGTIAG